MDPRKSFVTYYAATRAILRCAKPPAQYARPLQKMHEGLSRVTDDIIQTRQVQLACKAGCSFCCHIKVDAHAHEVLYVADHLRKKSTPSEIENIVVKSRAHAATVQPMTLEQQMRSANPCPLLKDGQCIAYEARPISCRIHHSKKVSVCEELFNGGDPSKWGSVDTVLEMNGAAVWSGVERAFTAEGFDSRTYDFGSAIGEALENSSCARRWRDKKHAFGAEFAAKEPAATPVL